MQELPARVFEFLHRAPGVSLGTQGDRRKPQEKTHRKEFENIPERNKTMPLIKKAPAIVTLEVKVEEPVKQLLEDYAQFIESSPDHVVNSVIKKSLWRDPEYRKWREQHRAASLDKPGTTAPARG
jgi:hypothetical protein